MSYSFSFDLELEVYQVQRRPGRAQLLINDAYAGVAVVDVAQRGVADRIAFPNGYGVSTIGSWCLRADGDVAIAFDDDRNVAAWFSFAEQTSRQIAHTPWPITAGMPYDWRGNALWVKDPDAFRFAVLREGERVFAEVDGFQALQEDRAWRRALDRMRRADGRLLLVEPENAHLLYVAPKHDACEIGIIGWVDQGDLAVQTAKPPSRIAAYRQNLFVLYEYEAQILCPTGDVSRRLLAPEGFRFSGLDAVPLDATPGCLLVLVSRALDGSDLTRFSVYEHRDD